MARDYFIDHIATLSPLELERRAWQYVRADLFADESGLYNTKWWDYKPLHPLHATYEFAEDYIEAYERAARQRKDAAQARYMKPLKFRNFLKCGSQVVTGMWKARQFADAIGCPYDFYCTRAMQHAAKADWRYLPQPHMLYSTKSNKGHPSMLEQIALDWEERQRGQLQIAKSDFYRNDNYCGNVYQIQHQRMLMQRLEGGSGNREVLATAWVFNQKVLLPDLVRARLGDNFFNYISSLAAD